MKDNTLSDEEIRDVNAHIKDWSFAGLDLMTSVASLLICLVYLPRIGSVIYMRHKKDKFKRRKIAFIVRTVTCILQIFFLLVAIIGLIILTVKSYGVLGFISVPGIACYVLALIWCLCLDIYFTFVFRSYHKKTKNKKNGGHSHTRVQDVSVISVVNHTVDPIATGYT